MKPAAPVCDFFRLKRGRKIEVTLWFFALWFGSRALVDFLAEDPNAGMPWFYPVGIEFGFMIYFGWPVVIGAAISRTLVIFTEWGVQMAFRDWFSTVFIPAALMWPLALPLRRVIQFKSRLDTTVFVYSLAPILLIGFLAKAALIAGMGLAFGQLTDDRFGTVVLRWWAGDLSGTVAVLPLVLAVLAPAIAERRAPALKCLPRLAGLSVLALGLWFALAYALPGDHFAKWYLIMPLILAAAWMLSFEMAMVFVTFLNLGFVVLRTKVPSGGGLFQEQFFLAVLMYLTMYLAVLKSANERLMKVLEKTQARTNEAIKEHAYFLTMLSHELKTPLNLILGFSDVGDGIGSPGTSSQIVRRSTERLIDIVNKMSFLGSSGLSAEPLAVATVDIRDLMQKVLFRFEGRAILKDIHLELDYRSQKHRLHTSAVSLELALSELLDNALKFSHHGVIRLAVTSHGKKVRFSIADEGIGIDGVQAKRLLNTFEQGERGFGRRFQGLGIGLSFVSLLVEILHGRLEVENLPGRPGACFSFEIPDLVEWVDEPRLTGNTSLK